MRLIRSIRPAVLAGVLMLAASSCSSESNPRLSPNPSPGAPSILNADCLDLQHDGDRLAVKLVRGLHAIDPDKTALNGDFSAGKDNTVELLGWILLGAGNEKDADGQIVVYGTERTASFPAVESMQRTIVESTGTGIKASQLDLGRTRVANVPAETAVLSGKNGEDDAWTFTSGKTRFIVFAHQQPHRGAFDLTARVPSLFSLDSCPQG